MNVRANVQKKGNSPWLGAGSKLVSNAKPVKQTSAKITVVAHDKSPAKIGEMTRSMYRVSLDVRRLKFTDNPPLSPERHSTCSSLGILVVA